MNREQLAHVLRAAARIVNDPDILVIGSQAILGSFEDDCAWRRESAAADRSEPLLFSQASGQCARSASALRPISSAVAIFPVVR